MKAVLIKSGILLIAGLIISLNLQGQYFGRNKPGYTSFDFNVCQTPHFEIYHYLENDTLLSELGASAEKWYRMHQQIFKDTFKKHNPLIIYNHHADFQQTNAINSMIGSGTGGVTEGLKNRVVMPVAFTKSQTDHVLGHEMVHAFQFHSLLKSDSNKTSLQNLPLWMIEGMAEYLSIGSYDPNTAMWMRDALINKDFPTLEELTRNSKYFPYRYGHAFWATVGKTWGDTIIYPLFMETARSGYSEAIEKLIGVNDETFSGMWKSAMMVHYSDYLNDSTIDLAGDKIISEKNAGRINISPAVSPDGRYVAFFSEKNLFTLDLFLYDLHQDKIVKKLSSTVKYDEIDDFNFIESSGTWSPDSKRFAFVIVVEGKNKLAILDVQKAKILEEIEIDELHSFTQPAWSPDGRYIVVSGLRNGINDLYLYDFETGKTSRITNDYLSNIHPGWSPDAKSIVFAAEKYNNEPGYRKYSFDIAIYDLEKKTLKNLEIFQGAYNFNPLFSPDQSYIYFLSDMDGFRNLYRYETGSGKIYRITEYMTGITGMTSYSPAISIAAHSGELVYTYYFNNSYSLFFSMPDEFEITEVNSFKVNRDAGILPPMDHVSVNIVDTNLYFKDIEPEVPVDSFREVPYRPRFKLDYISNVNAGVSTGRYGTGMAGSAYMIFSDIVGNNQLFASLALNGEIFDFGGQVAYMNQKGGLNWGASLSHIPYRSAYSFFTEDTVKMGDEKIRVNKYVIDYIRMFKDEVSVFSYYPLSKTRRFEAGASMAWYYYRIDRYNNYYSANWIKLGETREKQPSPDGFSLQQLDIAYVEDNSFFGMTAPMQGHRSRVQLEKYFGAIGYYSFLFDYRKYFYMKPLNLSFRIYHYGRYGNNAVNDMVSPLFLGYPTLIRGYESNAFYEKPNSEGNYLDIAQLTGSKIVVGNAEIRLPFSGPERLALIKSKWLWSDFNLFFDGGLAWHPGDEVSFNWHHSTVDERIPVYSAGASLRINLFGYMVIEPFYAFPFQNGGLRDGVFGINFSPGW